MGHPRLTALRSDHVERYSPERDGRWRYALALSASCLALLLTLAVPDAYREPALLPGLIAVAIVSWFLGSGPGVLTLIINITSLDYFVVPPIHNFTFAERGEAVRLILYSLICAAAVLACHRLRHAQRVNDDLLASRESVRLDSDMARARAESIFDHAGVGILEVDSSFRFMAANDSACEILGYRRYELLGLTVHELTAPEDRARSDEMNAQLEQGLLDRFSYEKRYLRRDGSALWTHVTVSAVRSSTGGFLRAIATVEDISERKGAEDALRQSETQFRQLAEVMPQLVWSTRADGYHEYFNQHWYDYTQSALEDCKGEGWAKLLHPDDHQRTLERWQHSLRTGEPYEIENRYRRGSDGAYRWFIGRALPVRDCDGNVVRWFGTCTDVEDFKRSQEALIRAEKLASVGRMAATIAHEINNPLTAVMNAIFLAATDASLSESARCSLEVAQQELQRVAHITKQTLGFYRESGNRTAVSLTEILDQTVNLYGPKLRNKSISVERRYRGAARAWAMEGELRQIVSNLISNSIEAVSIGGKLHIRTAGAAIAGGSCAAVRLTIADTGSGIMPQDLQLIFEPFFTTKKSFGTGLGLWISRELVKRHGGKIRVRSRLGKGTVFCIWLPAAQGQQALGTAA